MALGPTSVSYTIRGTKPKIAIVIHSNGYIFLEGRNRLTDAGRWKKSANGFVEFTAAAALSKTNIGDEISKAFDLVSRNADARKVLGL